MKHYALILSIAFSLSALSTQAQRSIRIGYIDMDYILENVPEYKEAQSQLDTKVTQWKAEMEKMTNEIDQMKKTLENERILLTQELIEEREEDIAYLQNELLEYQQARFGPGGDLIIQRSNLVEPIQDQVFNAVQEISKNRQYDFVFDKSAELVMLYANERHDISDQILLSINRASRRNQVSNRGDRKELERDEALTVEQDKEVRARELEQQEKQTERERIIEERRAQREAEKAAKQKEFEARRQKLLEERQAKKDSILQARKNPGSTPAQGETKEKEEEMSAEKRRQMILEQRQKRRDSILAERKKKKDSIN